MSVEDDLLKIKEIKKSLNTAIRAKGSDIADDTKFDQYPVKIDEITSDFPLYTVDENGNTVTYVLENFIEKKIRKISTNGLCGGFSQGKFAFSTVTFENLEEIGNGGLSNAFQNMNSNLNQVCLKSVNFPKLKIIRQTGLMYAFSNCFNLEEANFPELMLIENGAFDCAFANDSKLTKISFPKLSSIDGDPFGYSAFPTSVLEIHFPKRIQSKIQSLASSNKNFGASKGHLYFDL